jgi:hypothetical protein
MCTTAVGATRFVRELIHDLRDRLGRHLPLDCRMDAACFQEEILALRTREDCEYAIKGGLWRWVGLRPLVAAHPHWTRVNVHVCAFETELRLGPLGGPDHPSRKHEQMAHALAT